VTLILADKINSGLGKCPMEQKTTYELTNEQNIMTGPEREMFNNDVFYLRLADEAANHNIAVNIVALPFNY